MTRLEYIRKMPVEELAEKIVNLSVTDEYCDSSCESEDYTCPHELECCIRWLGEERGNACANQCNQGTNL